MEGIPRSILESKHGNNFLLIPLTTYGLGDGKVQLELSFHRSGEPMPDGCWRPVVRCLCKEFDFYRLPTASVHCIFRQQCTAPPGTAASSTSASLCGQVELVTHLISWNCVHFEKSWRLFLIPELVSGHISMEVLGCRALFIWCSIRFVLSNMLLWELAELQIIWLDKLCIWSGYFSVL